MSQTPSSGALTSMAGLIVITSGSTLVRDANGNVTVTGVAGAGATISVYVDGGAQPIVTVTADNSGTFTATFPLPPGPHTIRVVDELQSEAVQDVTVQ